MGCPEVVLHSTFGTTVVVQFSLFSALIYNILTFVVSRVCFVYSDDVLRGCGNYSCGFLVFLANISATDPLQKDYSQR
jgi:hypothetical protein